MSNFEIIQNKLEEFIRKYYTNELIKGIIFFFSIGLLYSIFLLSLEYFLWINSLGRSIMFWSFVGVQVLLISKYLFLPIIKLLKLSRGIDYVQASAIIGKHFPEVGDKLLNVLQLKNNQRESELLLAGIEQKVKEMKTVPFKNAVDFRKNTKYTKFAIVPLLLIFGTYLSGNSRIFTDGYERVVNYEVAYEPPAPFSFMVLNDELKVRENGNFNLLIETKGEIFPDNVQILMNGESYFLKNTEPGKFLFNFQNVQEQVEFQVVANEVKSPVYRLVVVKVPKMKDFKVLVDYPAYTKMKDEVVGGTGNLRVPEGSSLKWKLITEETKEVNFRFGDTLFPFQKKQDLFEFEKIVHSVFPYSITTSNDAVKEYEVLNYSVEVIKDEYPKIYLESKQDSINEEVRYFKGRATDDYGISDVNLIYYHVEEPESRTSEKLNFQKGNLIEFMEVFPGERALEKGKTYEYYFRVMDNDVVNGFKSVKSKVFSFRKKTDEEKLEENFQEQKESIKGLENSLDELEKNDDQLEEIDRIQKEKKNLDYNDRRKLKNFLERQKNQEELMKKYQQKLKKTLEERAEENPYKKELERRLESNEKKLEENEKLRKELEKYADKINEEKLAEKLEQMSKQTETQEKSLEQLLELTKRYYVKEKQKKLAKDLKQLAKEQEELAKQKEEENPLEKQKELSKKFQEIKKDLEELQKENRKLQEPMQLPDQEKEQKKIDREQKESEENLKNQNPSDAKKNQKNAAEEMKKMGQKMMAQMQMQSGEMMSEDSETLRQILENLIKFSFEQEALMDDFQKMNSNHPQFPEKLRKQNVLKTHFQHVDDSLYSLALRNPMVTEKILEKLTDVKYDIENSLERLADNKMSQALASQQYVVTGANDLALFLGEMLKNMQMSASGSGGGKSGGKGFQLPDIIKKQGELSQQMKQAMKKGQQGKQGKGEGGSKGEGKSSGKGGERGSGKSSNGKGQRGAGGYGEEMSKEIFEIYKQQEVLRQQLKDRLAEDGFTPAEKGILNEMEEMSQELLERGLDETTAKSMEEIKHKLIQLKNASFKQGQEDKRKAETNADEQRGITRNLKLKAKEYFQSTEILNRQALPLRQIYKQKVEEYFEDSGN